MKGRFWNISVSAISSFFSVSGFPPPVSFLLSFSFDNKHNLVQSYLMDIFNISPIPELVFGAGTFKRLPDIITAGGFENIAVITGGSSFINSGFWQELTDFLAVAGINFYQYKSTGETSPERVDEIVLNLKHRNIDAVIAIGGGTVMDTGKAVSAMLCMPGSIVDYLEGVGTKEPTGERKYLICVPTTSGTGSEVTKNAVITKIGKNGFKKSLRHKGYIPDIAVIDPELTIGCPSELTVAAGLDAITQLLESYVSSKSNSFTDNLALHGLKLAGRSLPRLVDNGNDLDAREEMAYAAYLSGITLANAGLGVVHGAASVLGALRPIPHGVVCGTLLGSATETIIDKLSKGHSISSQYLLKFAEAGSVLTGNNCNTPESNRKNLISTLNTWVEDFGISRLSDYGFTEKELIDAAEITGLKNTPCSLESQDIRNIFLSRL